MMQLHERKTERHKRGFITVATGDMKYYQLAANLLKSYKKRGKGRYPFGIICDQKNEYTKLFDDVILVKDVRRSTLDKLLMRYSAYEESIFIDADTLILDNIDDLWEMFSEQDDVSVFGCTLPLDSQKGWFTYEGSGKYKSKIKYLLSMNGGIYYFRKTDRAESVFQTALNLIEDYSEIDFKYFKEPQDEPLMAMSLVLHECKPCASYYEMIILPACAKKVSTNCRGDVYIGKEKSKTKMIHFSTARTTLFLYNYLNELNYQEYSWGNCGNYWRFKCKYGYRDLKFQAFHICGAVLRKHGLGNIVEKLKKIL